MHIVSVLFYTKGAANNYIMNPYTHQEISADSIIERVMTFAPLYGNDRQRLSCEPIYKR